MRNSQNFYQNNNNNNINIRNNTNINTNKNNNNQRLENNAINNIYSSNMHQNNISNLNKSTNLYMKRKKYEYEKNKEKEIEKMKKENEIENNIRDVLQCYICLSKVINPTMCNYCKRICCEKCIKKWLENHNYCGICKHRVTINEMITIPFLNDMSTFFINNIDNHQKKNNLFDNQTSLNKINQKTMKPNKGNKKDGPFKVIYNNNIIKNIDNNESMPIENNGDIITERGEEEENFCIEHGNKIDFYCIQCNKYFCSQCLIFFGEESKKHSNHYIIKVEKINDLGVTEAIKEYEKLPQTKGKIENLIGLCNLKIKENEIKKYEILKILNTIKDLYIKKYEEDSKNIKNVLKEVKIKKNEILEKISFNNNNNSNNNNNNNNNINNNNNNNNDNNNNNNIFKNELNKIKQLNRIDPKIGKQIEESSKIIDKLYVENYQTDFLDFIIPVSGSGNQFSENQLLVNSKIKISNYMCELIIKHSQKKIIIIFYVKLNEAMNDPSFPIIQTYIIFRNQKYGLEFIHLTNPIIAQNLLGKYDTKQNREQINSIELEVNKFLYLCNEQNKISLKILVTKSFYK